MIFFLNQGLILEQEIAKAVKSYFKIAGAPKFYENYSINITNDHPFAKMLLSRDAKAASASLFPAIVVTTDSEGKPDELVNLNEAAYLTIEPPDLPTGEEGIKDFCGRHLMMTPAIIEEMRAAMVAHGDNKLFGYSISIRRQDHISIEIWAKNPQLKNELYEAIRLFVAGWMRDYLEKLYEENALAIFDNTVRGQRSNNFNVDFGIELVGGQITFDADYVINQSVIDTDLTEINNNLFLEVINHVKGYPETTREWIYGPGDTEPGYGAEGSGDNAGDSAGNNETAADTEDGE
jgi:hypothetical protein